MVSYDHLLRQLRERVGVSQRSLAHELGISHTLLNRSETGTRLPAGPEEVQRIAAVLRLTSDELDQLLAAAGYWPSDLVTLGPADPTLRLLAHALTNPELSQATLAQLRGAIEAVIGAVVAASGGQVPAAGHASGDDLGKRLPNQGGGERAPEA